MTKNISVLIVEDDNGQNFEICSYLVRTGFNAISAYSIMEAMAEIQKSEPDIIVCDFYLEDQSALDLFEEIENANHAIPVVVITAEPSKDLTDSVLKHGAVDYIVKDEDNYYKKIPKRIYNYFSRKKWVKLLLSDIELDSQGVFIEEPVDLLEFLEFSSKTKNKPEDIFQLVPTFHHGELTSLIKNVLEVGSDHREIPLHSKLKSEKWVELYCKSNSSYTGDITITCSIKVLSEYAENMDAIHQDFSVFANKAPILMKMAVGNKLVFINNSWNERLRDTGEIAYKKLDFVLDNELVFHADKKKVRSLYDNVMKREKSYYNEEYRLWDQASNSYKWVADTCIILGNRRALFYAIDIDERKNAERNRDALEVFGLKDANHRVINNNLLVLNHLEKILDRIGSNTVRDKFTTLTSLVESIQVMHDELYSDRQEVKPTIMSLAKNSKKILEKVHKHQPKMVDFIIELDGVDAELNRSQYKELMRIVVEFYCNSMKHAFNKNQTDNRLRLKVKVRDDNCYVTLFDNGSGFQVNDEFIRNDGGLMMITQKIHALQNEYPDEFKASKFFNISSTGGALLEFAFSLSS